jgi:hypothetical protein
MKAIVVPIDNRPVTYQFPLLLGQVAGIEIIAPPREIMGSLTVNTSVNVLNEWLSHTIQRQSPDVLLVCLDSIIYGGLIPSRRIDATPTQILEQSKLIPKWKRLSSRPPKIYAQSSIMRISDNYDNTEEKQYWSRYGREIFAWSEALHRLSTAQAGNDPDATSLRAGELSQLEARIDSKVRKDYLDTRWRNYQLNRRLLEYAESGEIDFLVFSQDDSGQYGLNVMEKERLQAEAHRRNLRNVVAYSGADEVLMTLIGRWLIEQNGHAPTTNVVFSPACGEAIASRYEGHTIGESVANQMSAIGLTNRSQSGSAGAEFQIVVHTSGERQGDHIWLTGHPDLRNLNTNTAVAETIATLESSAVPCILCDVAYSNGADPLLLEQLLQRKDLLQKLWGYAGWNTTGNTIGSALATGIARWFSQKSGNDQRGQAHLTNALFIRLADDWAYQTQVRKTLGNDLSSANLHKLMAPQLERIKEALGIQPPKIDLTLPWNRSFEVEVTISNALQPTR